VNGSCLLFDGQGRHYETLEVFGLTLL